jgi:protein phosphatase
MVKVKSAYFLNEIGSRTNNEDSIYPSKKAIPSQLVFLVCDGVGGAEGGEKASKIAANTIGSQLQEKILTNKEVN